MTNSTKSPTSTVLFNASFETDILNTISKFLISTSVTLNANKFCKYETVS